MADIKRMSLAAAVFAASTALAGPAAIAADLKLFATADVPASRQQPVTSILPLLQPFPGEPRAANTRTTLVPFEQATSAMRLAGEDDSAVLTFSLTGAQRAAGGQLQLSYRNAVSVLPESGVVDVEVNGKALGSFAIRSPNGFAPETVAVSADLLREGRNEARIRVRQHHRVDCSLEASYELWTEFDPVTSGFIAQTGGGFRTVADLLSVGRSEGGVTDIRLVMGDKATASAANESLALIQSLALYLNRPDIAVSVGSEPGQGPGIDIYVGSPETYRASPAIAVMLDNAPDGLSVRDAAAGRAALLLVGTGREDIEAKLVDAVSGPMRAGFDSGVHAASFRRLVAEPSSRYTLKDTGYRTQPFAGRLSNLHFDIEMPADFYPAEYGAIDFALKGATAPGLKPGAQLLVRVNGNAVRSYPFRDARGEEFQGKRLELPLRAFHPGVNRVEIIAELPVESDAACAPQARDDSRPRFILLDESELHVPALARIGRLPDLAAFSGSAYPFTAGKPFDIFLDNSDPRTLGAAMTMMARLSQSARAPLSGEITFSQPEEGRHRDALVISSGLSLAALAPAKGARVAMAQSSPGGLDPVTTASVADVALATATAAGDSRSLLEAFHSSTALERENLSITDKLSDWARRAAGRFGQWLHYGNGTHSADDTSGALVTLTQSRSPLGSATWTVVKAANPADLEKGVVRLTAPAAWQALEGGTATIGAENLELVTHAAGARYVYDLSDMGFLNLRRIVAAWFSDNFQFYIVLLIGLMTGVALWLGRIVPRMGVRTEK